MKSVEQRMDQLAGRKVIYASPTDRATPGAKPTWPGPAFDPWEEFVVPPFPVGALPAVIGRWVEDQSRVTGADPAALAMAALGAFSGALDHRFKLRMMRHGTWTASPRLWVLLVGDPSRKKTPVMNAATAHLEFRQDQAKKAHARAMAEHKAAKGDSSDEPEPPARYVAADATVEKLAEILARSERGLLLKRDELMGWIGAMEKYASGKAGAADRAFWLKAYDGGSFYVDRISRGEIGISNLSVSIIGGIQPARLAEVGGLTSDGLLQRFLPVMMGSPQFPEDMPADASTEAYRRLLDRLLNAEPQQLVMTEQALEASDVLRRELFDIEGATEGLEPGFQAFVGKLPGVFGAIALILHMAEHPEHGNTCSVELDTVRRAAAIVRDFLIPHAREFYRRSEADSDGGRLRKIASYILTAGRPRITSSDLTKNVAAMRGLGMGEVAKWLSPLVAGGWLEPVDPLPTNRAWHVRPDIFVQMKRRLEIEEARKATLARLMNSGRRSRNDSDT